MLRLNNHFLNLFLRTTGRDGLVSYSGSSPSADNQQSYSDHIKECCPHLREIKNLLDAGADINFASRSTGVTALAAEIMHPQPRIAIVRYLLSMGALISSAQVL
jgi:ankyrin repeat protein